ncbi:MAG: hypothetical protein ACOCUF_03060 [Patescibacteria group bacterium]
MNKDDINKKEGAKEKTEENLALEEGKGGSSFFNSGYFKLTLLFLVGFLVGIMFKTQALSSFTSGFEDYKISEYKSDYFNSSDSEPKSQPQPQPQPGMETIEEEDLKSGEDLQRGGNVDNHPESQN